MEQQGVRSEQEVRRSAYEAYLVARSTGKRPTRKCGVTMLEQYAIALGVHHYFRGKGPVTAQELEERAELASPRSCAGFSEASEIERLSDFLLRRFPSGGDPRIGESAVDAAVRLLEELDGARKLASESVALVRDAVQGALRDERKKVSEYLRTFPGSALLTQIEVGIARGDYVGPTPPDPGARADLPGPWTVLPCAVPEFVEAAKNACLELVSQPFGERPRSGDVQLDSGAAEQGRVMARGLSRDGDAWLVARLLSYPAKATIAPATAEDVSSAGKTK